MVECLGARCRSTFRDRVDQAALLRSATTVVVCVRVCVILRLYADRVAEEGCRRGLRDVSELVWEDALVRTTLVTCRFCYSKPPLTLARVYQSVGQTTRHRLRHDLFIPGLNEHLQTLKKVVTRH